MSQMQFLRSVFFRGSAASAARTIEILRPEGIPVVALVDDEAGVHEDGPCLAPSDEGGVTVLRGARVRRIEGHIANFRLSVQDAGGAIMRYEAGAIFIDAGPRALPQPEIAAKVPAENLLTVAQLERLAASDRDDGAPCAVAVWLDPHQGLPHRPSVNRVFRAIRRIAERGDTTFHVLFRHVPLSGLDGQELYDDLRLLGVRFFRLGSAPPALAANNGRVEIILEDSILPDPPVRLLVDRLLSVGPPAPRTQIPVIGALMAGPDRSDVFLQKDNVRLYPFNSLRKGIYCPGAFGEDAEEDFAEGLPAILSEVLAPLRSGILETPERMTLDKGRCVSCLTCYRVCPHHALDIRLGSTPTPVDAACQECGLCESLCPGRAIRLTRPSGPGATRPRPGTAATGESPADASEWQIGSATSVVFGCARSVGDAWKEAISLGLRVPEGVSMVPIRCACSLDEETLLDAFLKGAAKVLVLACHQENCASRKGTDAARRRVKRVAEYIEASGRRPSECLTFATCSSNEPHRLAGLLRAWA